MIKPYGYLKFFLLTWFISHLAMEIDQQQEEEHEQGIIECGEKGWTFLNEIAKKTNMTFDAEYTIDNKSDRTISKKAESYKTILLTITRMNEAIRIQKQALQEIESPLAIEHEGADMVSEVDASFQHIDEDGIVCFLNEEIEYHEAALLAGIKRKSDVQAAEQGLSKRLKRNKEKTAQAEKPFKCDDSGCQSAFTTKSNLTRHKKRKHLGERPFRCDKAGCKSAFNTKNSLTTHQKYKHSEERPFKCSEDGCNKDFKNKGILSRHWKSKHSEERPFKCDKAGCKSAFKTKSYLTAHTKSKHSEERPFKCDKAGCNKSFKAKGALQQHNQHKHSEEKAFKCAEVSCNSAFKTKGGLNRHKKNRHTK